MKKCVVWLLLNVAACGGGGDTAPRVQDVRGDSVAREVAQPGAVDASADTGSTSFEPAGGGELDAPVSSAPASSSPPGTRTQPQRAPDTDTDGDTEPARGDEGAAILRRAAAAYENVRSLRANFVMLYENTLLRQRTTSRGTLYQRRPDRIALRFTDPAGDLLIGDGERFYWYLPSVDERQVLCAPASQGSGSGAVDLQAQFVGNPVDRFQYTLHGTEQVDGRSANVMTLVPRQRAEYRSLKVWLDTRDSLARRFEITEQNGTVRRFDLDDMVTNPSIPDATFRFTPPSDARVVGC